MPAHEQVWSYFEWTYDVGAISFFTVVSVKGIPVKSFVTYTNVLNCHLGSAELIPFW